MSSNSPICQRCHALYFSENKTNMRPKCLEEKYLELRKQYKDLLKTKKE